MESLSIYRELSDPSPSLVEWLEARDQLFVVQDPKGVEHVYVDNDTPRDSDITDELVGGPETPHVGCTKGFALFSADGSYVASFARLDAAIRAKAGARVEIKHSVEGIDANAGWNSIEGDGTEDEPE